MAAISTPRQNSRAQIEKPDGKETDSRGDWSSISNTDVRLSQYVALFFDEFNKATLVSLRGGTDIIQDVDRASLVAKFIEVHGRNKCLVAKHDQTLLAVYDVSQLIFHQIKGLFGYVHERTDDSYGRVILLFRPENSSREEICSHLIHKFKNDEDSMNKLINQMTEDFKKLTTPEEFYTKTVLILNV